MLVLNYSDSDEQWLFLLLTPLYYTTTTNNNNMINNNMTRMNWLYRRYMLHKWCPKLLIIQYYKCLEVLCCVYRSSWTRCTSTSRECDLCWSVTQSLLLATLNITRRSSSLRQSLLPSPPIRINWYALPHNITGLLMLVYLYKTSTRG